VWASAPEAAVDVVVLIRVMRTIRYIDEEGSRVALDIGETFNITETFRKQEVAIRATNRKKVLQDVFDHRLGNKIHSSILLLEAGKMDLAKAELQSIRTFLDVHRGYTDCVLSGPMAIEEFLSSTCSAIDITCEQLQCSVQFFDKEGSEIKPHILAHRIFDDLTSNIAKHGVSPHIVFEGDCIILTNKIQQGPDAEYSSHSGLRSIEGEARNLNIEFEYAVKGDEFVAKIHLTCHLSSMEAGTGEEDTTPRKVHWILLEDDPKIVHFFSVAMRKLQVGPVSTIQTAAEVRRFVNYVEDSCLNEYVTNGRVTVCIMDENVVTMNEHGETTKMTGTELRAQLRTSQVAHRMMEDNRLFLVSYSADCSVEDTPDLLLKEHKGFRTAELVKKVFAALPSVNL